MSDNWKTISTSKANGVAYVTLNRPARMNAFVPEMGDELLLAFRQFEDDSDVAVIVLTGAGRGFCAGADRDIVNSVEMREQVANSAFLRDFAPLIHGYRKVTVAAVNGPAAGIGVTAILGFDFILMVRSARLVFPFAALNMVPGMGSTFNLPRRVGVRKAVELMVLGEPIGADAAAAIGLVTQVVEDGKLDREVALLTDRLMRLDGSVLTELRDAIVFGAENRFDTVVAREQEAAAKSVASARNSRP